MVNDASARPVRLAHFSDVHLTAPRLGWRPRHWLSRRLTGWINYRFLGRGRSFHDAESVIRKLMSELDRRRPDHVLFSGDATTLGFEAEFAHAALLLKVAAELGLPGLAVPGNHDYYDRSAAASGLFERFFAPWQEGERVDGARYPFAQRVGPLWLIGLNSSTGNFWSWDASGAVDAAQLDRLTRLVGRLAPGLRILVTHYPVCTETGLRERRTHRLRNVEEVVAVAAKCGISLWLHGHRHGPYWINNPALAPFPIICAGSATHRHHVSYGEYTITGHQLCAVRRVLQAGQFLDQATFEFELPGWSVPSAR